MNTYILRNNEQHGPYTRDVVLEMLRQQQLARADLYWQEGMAEWQPLAQLAAPLQVAGQPVAVRAPQRSSSSTCHTCGAPRESAAPSCKYCGTEHGAIRITAEQWVKALVTRLETIEREIPCRAGVMDRLSNSKARQINAKAAALDLFCLPEEADALIELLNFCDSNATSLSCTDETEERLWSAWNAKAKSVYDKLITKTGSDISVAAALRQVAGRYGANVFDARSPLARRKIQETKMAYKGLLGMGVVVVGMMVLMGANEASRQRTDIKDAELKLLEQKAMDAEVERLTQIEGKAEKALAAGDINTAKFYVNQLVWTGGDDWNREHQWKEKREAMLKSLER